MLYLVQQWLEKSLFFLQCQFVTDLKKCIAFTVSREQARIEVN